MTDTHDSYADLIRPPTQRGRAFSPEPGTFDLLAADKAASDAFEPQNFWELHKLASADTHIVTQAMDAQLISGFQPDPSFGLDMGEVMEDMRSNGLPLSYAEELVESQSADEYRARLELYTRKLSDASYIARHGWKGFAANITATLSDPAGMAVDAVTSIAAGAGIANRGRKLLAAAGAAGTANALIGAGQSQVNPDYDAKTLLADFAMGAGIGAMFDIGGSLLRADERMELHNAIVGIGNRVKAGAFGPDSGSAARVPGSQVEQGMDVNLLSRSGGDLAADIAADADEGQDIATVMPELRRFLLGGTNSARMRTSIDPEMRAIGRRLVPDDVRQVRHNPDGTTEDVVNEGAASDFTALNHARLHTAMRIGFEDGAREWFEAKGRSAVSRNLSVDARREFASEVTDHMRGAPASSPAVAKAAAAVRKMFDDGHALMLHHGVKGVTPASRLDNYVPRVKRADLWPYLTARMTTEQVDVKLGELVSNAIRTQRESLGLPVDDGLTDKAGKAYANWLLRGEDARLNRTLSGNDLDFFDDILDEAGLPAAEREAVLDYLQRTDRKTGDASVPSSRLKHRLSLNEMESIQLDDGSTLRFTDLLENDIEKLAERSSQHVSGLAGLAEAGIKDWRQLDAMLNAKAGNPALAKELTAARTVVRQLLGHPTEANADSGFSRAARALGSVNFAAMMGQVGWAALADTGASLGLVGFRAAIKQFPALRQVLRQAKDGTMGDELARDCAVLCNPGATLLRSSVSARADSAGLTGSGGKWSKAAENVLSGAQRGVAMAGGLLPVQDVQQLMLARGFAQRVFDWSKAGKVPDAWVGRLKDYGLSPEDQAALIQHMTTHARADGSVLVSAGVDHLDPVLQRKVELLFHRMTRHGVQEGDPGAAYPWMNSPLARLVFQFRQFSLVALNRRSLHGISRMDAVSGLSLMWGMVMGSVGIVGRAYLNYPEGHPAREALNDPKQLAKSAFAATGEASIIPMMVDTMFTVVGQDKPFFSNFHRSTGLGSDFVSGIPSVATANKVGEVLGLPGRIVRPDREVSEEDMRALAGLIPMNNILGINRFNRWLASQFPNDAEVQQRERLRDLLAD